MKKMKDSSEIQDVVALCNELISQAAIPRPATTPLHSRRQRRASGHRHRSASRYAPSAGNRGDYEPVEVGEHQYRGDRLESMLYAMCKRGGFQGAVLIDNNGFLLASYNSPVNDPLAAGFTMILGEALEKAGKLIRQGEVNSLSVDINYTDKAVIRRFSLAQAVYLLMIVCSQEIDERAEVELSIDKILSILKKD